MKRFIVFTGAGYYPGGGWNDFHSDHDMAEEAVKAADQQLIADLNDDWSHVVDTSTGKVIYNTTSTKVFEKNRAAKETTS